MQRGQHVGKIVVTMPRQAQSTSGTSAEETLKVTNSAKMASFRSDFSYLLVGGLGGLGRAVSTWMVEHGARNIILMSRSGGDSEHDKAFVNELSAQGCVAQIFKRNAASTSEVERAIRGSNKPVAGVMLMSMVLRVRLGSSASPAHPSRSCSQAM